MIRLTCGNTVRYVINLYIIPSVKGECTYGLVNNGHYDLFDLGFSHEELSENNLLIEYVPDAL